MVGEGRLVRGIAGGLAAMGAAVLLSACGGGSSGGGGTTASGSSTAAGGGGGGSSCSQQIKATVAKEKAPMQIILPGASLDMSKNQGKSIWYVSPSQATGYALDLSKAVTTAAKAAGMSVSIFDGKGQPDRFTQGLQQAVAQKADGIILYGIDPALVPEGLKAAKAAGVPVITMFSGKPAPPDGTVAEALNEDLAAQAKYMADYGAYTTDCKVNGATSYDTTYPSLVKERDGIKATLQQLCPDTCQVQNHPMKLADMATALGPSTQSLIQRNPDLNVIFATFDQAATYQIPAVEQSGADVKIVGTNALLPNLQQIQKGSPQVADVAYMPPEYTGWLCVDQIGRAMQGEKLGDPSGKPFVLSVQTFDKQNLPQDPSDFSALFPKLADYESQFKQKWGL